jgi:hypothetical protein
MRAVKQQALAGSVPASRLPRSASACILRKVDLEGGRVTRNLLIIIPNLVRVVVTRHAAWLLRSLDIDGRQPPVAARMVVLFLWRRPTLTQTSSGRTMSPISALESDAAMRAAQVGGNISAAEQMETGLFVAAHFAWQPHWMPVLNLIRGSKRSMSLGISHACKSICKAANFLVRPRMA